MNKICNYCPHLGKVYIGKGNRFFDAVCNKRLVEQPNKVFKPALVDNCTYEMADIERPNWCPIHEANDDVPTQSAQVTPPPLPIQKEYKDMNYTEKREEWKKLPRRLKWEDIKEDGYYMIPKIMTTPRKLLHVEVKTDSCLRCHEISEYTGTEYTTITNIYPNDIEALMIVELHNF